MRLKIVSDGTFAGTRVMDLATDSVLQGLVEAQWSVVAGDEAARVVLIVEGVMVQASPKAIDKPWFIGEEGNG